MDYGVAGVHSRVLGEIGALMRPVSDINPGAPLQEVQLPNDGLIIEPHTKYRSRSVAS